MDKSFSNRCRCCAGLQECREGMMSLFEENLTEMFTYCTALEIASNDNLPSHICLDCFGLLSNFNKFRQNCIDSDAYFRGQIATDSIKVEDALDAISIKCEDDQPNRDFESKFFVTECNDTGDRKYDPNLIVQSLSTSNDVHVPMHDSNPSDETQFVCDYCGRVFNKKNSIRSHMTMHKKEIIVVPESKHIACTVEGCRKVFATQQILNSHRRKKHKILVRENIKFSCQQCPKWFAVQHKLGAHIRREHEGLKPYKCPQCEEEFCKYRTYDNHMKFQHNTAEYERFHCSYEGCDKEYRVKAILKDHIDRVHLGIKKRKDQKLLCGECGRSFKNSSNFQAHCNTHSDIRPFPCKICPKRFSTSYKLKIHAMRHLNDRPFVCPTCGARKATNKELQAHLNFHTKAISYPCKECDRVFTSYAAVNRHVRIHHRNHKPYICPHCEKAFSKAETMKNHVMTHTGEKPFACPVCGHRFIQAVAMRSHMKVHGKTLS